MLPTPPSSPPLAACLAPEDRLGCILAGRLELTSILGVGAYGVVYTAVDIHTRVLFAVKALTKIGLDGRQRRFQDREIHLHYRANQHPNVLSMLRILDSADCTFVVLEYCPEGDLFSNITERNQFVGNDPLAKHAFLQILDAVQHCHSLGIYHRDLKPENILVTDQGSCVKLADFGLATTDRRTPDFGCGSTFYMAPECQIPTPSVGEDYASAPSDVWSLGVILVNLTCGRNPWKRASAEDSTYRAYTNDREFLRTILPISSELCAILARVFDCCPGERISLQELRDLIVACPRLTTSYPSPPLSPQPSYTYNDTFECVSYTLPPASVTPPPPQLNPVTYPSWSCLEFPAKRGSASSLGSHDSGYHSEASYSPDLATTYTPFQPVGSIASHTKAPFYLQQQPLIPSMVAVY